MKKTGALCFMTILLSMMTGCAAAGQGGSFSPKEDSIYLTNKGEISSALVYTSETDQSLYDAEELKSFAMAAVDSYNEEHKQSDQSTAVKLTQAKLEGNTGTLIFSYASGEDLIQFSDETGDDSHSVTALKVGNISQPELTAKAESITFETTDGKTVSFSEVVAGKKSMIAVVDGAAVIQTEGKIDYVSEGAKLVDSNTVKFSEGKNCIIYQ